MTDFGLAKVTGTALLGVGKFHLNQMNGASLRYAAPEVLQYLLPNPIQTVLDYKAIDVYATAMTMFEIVTRKIPFPDVPDESIIKDVLQGVRPTSHLNEYMYEPRMKNIAAAVMRGWSERDRPSIKTLQAALSSR